mgnify:FL=1
MSDIEKTSSCCGSESKPAPQNVAAASSCCGSSSNQSDGHAGHNHGGKGNEADSCCPPSDKSSIDWIMWTCLPAVLLGYAGFLWFGHTEALPEWLGTMFHTSYEMVNAMWWGVLSAAFFVGLLGRIPRELVMSVLGKGGSKRGIFRATMAGLMLDLCNHGILMVGMKLYERGASIGQVIAF